MGLKKEAAAIEEQQKEMKSEWKEVSRKDNNLKAPFSVKQEFKCNLWLPRSVAGMLITLPLSYLIWGSILEVDPGQSHKHVNI